MKELLVSCSNVSEGPKGLSPMKSIQDSSELIIGSQMNIKPSYRTTFMKSDQLKDN